MRYRTVVDETDRQLEPTDDVIQTVTVDPDHDAIVGLRAAVELGTGVPQQSSLRLELDTDDAGAAAPHPFYRLERSIVASPGVYTVDLLHVADGYPHASLSDWDQATDTVTFRLASSEQEVPVARSEVQVLEV